MPWIKLLAAASAAFLPMNAAQAVTVTDAAGDFLPSFTLPHDPDLDVLNFSVSYNPTASNFLLSATFAGAINPAAAGFYVIGVDTGTGLAAPFAGIGAPNVRFNQVVVVQKDGTGLVPGAGGGALDPAGITIAGSQFSALVPLALLPSTGFTPYNYGFNLWPRSGAAITGNEQISDFAPNNSTLAPVPETASWVMMIGGFGLIGLATRHRRRDMTDPTTT